MGDRWAEHPIRPGRSDSPASIVLAAATLVVAVLSNLVPLAGWLAAGASPVFDFQMWRPLLYALTTGSILQGIINGVFLVLVGRSLEPLLGSADFAAVYLLSGLGGATALSLTGVPASFSGAICGIFGILAATAVIKRLEHQDIRGDIILITLFVIWGILAGARDWTADIGAIVIGAVIGWVWARNRWATRGRSRIAYAVVAVVCLAALVVTWLT
ncbi:rhomboid family intramembrane serine protease [Acidipropionibacterium acidipropionici]|uniref:Rhomboid family intramembrane serine protease n=1 Tax=Acidipropionibacterium acidipropionici TaxID=1748 RepID=A0AAC9APM4_9ACTN|nr:rhomboid family intramembrane serine protease [Acidipropionibacterium acidipropionici]AMS07317.1 rhomboid family intramembrane serine protease [Acidipropionibacterium acidipropionici]AZP38456.1 rhomboid family intramembrane serine protease [Acidipropionibacterium acidipropionici]